MSHPLRTTALLAALAGCLLYAPAADAARRCPSPQRHGKTLHADVAVIGADAGGTGAAISAARRCLSVVLVSETSTPGGMLTAGQIGFVDGQPKFHWHDRPDAPFPNGSLNDGGSWALAGGLWREFRRGIAPDVSSTIRYQPAVGAASMTRLVSGTRGLRLLAATTPIQAHSHRGSPTSVSVRGAFNGRITARFWVDGTDDGELLGLLHLPVAVGDAAGDIMAYAYRWTAVHGSGGVIPTAPPASYGLNRAKYDSCVAQKWARYRDDFHLADGARVTVNPFRVLNNQGRITDGPQEKWDVNNCANDATTSSVAAILAQDPSTSAFFAKRRTANPYADAAIALRWSSIPWVEDHAPLARAGRRSVVQLIRASVKARAQGLLWYIRSGDMLAALHKLPGGQNISVDSDWSISNELGTPDGMPQAMYQREGRRAISLYQVKATDICPSFGADQPGGNCRSTPRYFSTGIALGDYSMDLKATSSSGSTVFTISHPFQVPFGALIPKDTRRLLVTGAMGSDRQAYGALRIDPLKLLVGQAAGEAIAEAARRHTSDLSRINVRRVRERLAEDHDETFYVEMAPSLQNGVFVDDVTGTTIQKLIARKLLRPAWARGPGQQPYPAPSADLNGTNSQVLTSLLAPGCCRGTIPWAQTRPGQVTHLTALGAPQPQDRVATVADAYAWLLRNGHR